MQLKWSGLIALLLTIIPANHGESSTVLKQIKSILSTFGVPHGDSVAHNVTDAAHEVYNPSLINPQVDFRRECLKGKCELRLEQGITWDGYSRNSTGNGRYRDFQTSSNRLTRWGTIQNGVKTGLEISIMHLAEASGFVLGRVDARGHLTGDNICLIIVQKSAGKWVSVCGRFRDGAIIQGRPTDYQDIRLVPNSDGTDWDLEIDNTTSEGSEDHELIFDFDPLMFGTRRDMMVAQMTWIYLQFIERPNSIFPFPTQEKDYQAVVLRVPYPHLRQTLTLEEYCPLLINSRLLPQSPTLWSISLASYPGAGSRWLMGHLSAETYLESVYFDSVANNTEQKSIFLTVKNHHQSPQSYHAPLTGQRREHEDIEWRMNDIMRFRGKSLVLIRNPYLAIVSYWNHAQVDEVDMNPNLNLAEDLRSTKFEAFFMNEIGLWFEVAADWIVIGSEVHVVHYEDMKNDLRSEMLRITRDFLNIHVHPTRQACFGLTQYQKFKRSTKLKLTQAMFTPEMIEKAESYMKRLDHLLRSNGHSPLPIDKYWM